jgi:hypothetical protein
MYPPKRRKDGSFPFVLYNLGGGINNLIFSLPFVIPLCLAQGIYAQIISFILLLSGVLTAATNIIPMSIGLQNDGMNVKSMLKGKYMREAFYLQLQVNAELSDGKQVSEYLPQTFKLPDDADSTNMLTAFVSLMSYYQQIAIFDFDAAEKILASMEEKSADYLPAIYNIIAAERLFFMVLRHCPPEEIASVYEQTRLFLSIAKTDVSIQRVRYVYEAFLSDEEKWNIMTLINKKPLKKLKACDREKAYRDFLKTAENYPVSGEADMNVKVVEYIRNNTPFPAV